MSMHLVTTGLAIFSMLFGAGNLIYPLLVGVTAGSYTPFGIASFLLSATILPLAGLCAMILFDGNYNLFFERLGKKAGQFLIFICMMVIGPCLAIPRITTLSFAMIAPFFKSTVSLENAYYEPLFILLFLGITFLATYQENKLIDVLGAWISPLLLTGLGIITTKGLWMSEKAIHTSTESISSIIHNSFMLGYETLDLMGAIFFASIIITILQQKYPYASLHKLSLQGLKAGLIGSFCLAIVYTGMGILGMYHGSSYLLLDRGQLFSAISFKILGSHGAIMIAITVLMACFSTSIALSAIIAEYFQKTIFNNRISYVQGLILTILLSIPLSLFGLDYVLKCAGGPLVHILYPILITITACNILHKLNIMHIIKLPTFLVTIYTISNYALIILQKNIY